MDPMHQVNTDGRMMLWRPGSAIQMSVIRTGSHTHGTDPGVCTMRIVSFKIVANPGTKGLLLGRKGRKRNIESNSLADII